MSSSQLNFRLARQNKETALLVLIIMVFMGPVFSKYQLMAAILGSIWSMYRDKRAKIIAEDARQQIIGGI